jgi:formylglycine-generating enzyme required for sulfatase activity
VVGGVGCARQPAGDSDGGAPGGQRPPCESDADCAPSGRCAGGRCRPANEACVSAADCGGCPCLPDAGGQGGLCDAACAPCVPSCDGLGCGEDDGCGGECAACPDGLQCRYGQCTNSECSVNLDCGISGFCDGRRCHWVETECESDWDCARNGRWGPEANCLCNYDPYEGLGAYCSQFCERLTCQPSCVGRACRGDGCGDDCDCLALEAVAAGGFVMGTPLEATGRRDDEEPPREVLIGWSFLMQVAEVSRGDWERLMGSRPWDEGAAASCEGPACPVTGVTWFDAVQFANALSTHEGLPACYALEGCATAPADLRDCDADGAAPWPATTCSEVVALGPDCPGYRLPSEAEWEYAARGEGRLSLYPWAGEAVRCDQAVLTDEASGCVALGPQPVCSRPAGLSAQRPWLCDLVGNVAEWVEDAHGPYAEAPADGGARQGAAEAPRVIRGGDWASDALAGRATARAWGRADQPGCGRVGFRLVRSAPAEPGAGSR